MDGFLYSFGCLGEGFINMIHSFLEYYFEYFSVNDIVSDYILFFDYSGEETVTKILSPLNDTSLLNDTLASCSLISEMEEGFEFHCVEYNPYFTSLTLAFIYLPSLNVIAALYGPGKAGLIGFGFGLFGIFIVGLPLTLIFFLGESGNQSQQALFVTGMTAMILGFGFIGLGVSLLSQFNSFKELNLKEVIQFWSLHCTFFPLFVAFSPFILVMIKLLAVFKKKSKLVQSQSMVASRGEAILEAAPQLILQLYIVLISSSSPSWTQWMSIITSILSLPIPIVEQYETARSEELGKNSIFKIFIFLPASLFKLLTLSITALFLREWIVLIYFVGSIGMVTMITKNYGPSQDNAECSILGWLTITNLGRSKVPGTNLQRYSLKVASLYRMISTIFYTIFNTIILSMILIICNTDPGVVTLPLIIIAGDDVVWSELPLVQNLSFLNILLIATIWLGWLPLVLDVIIASARFQYWGPKDKNKENLDKKEEDSPSDKEDQNIENEDGFWTGALLLEGLAYRGRKHWKRSHHAEEEETTQL